MHWIQKHILKKLSIVKDCRYKELIPEGVDGNLFMYHLNKLMKSNFIEKNNSLYTLTKEGKRQVNSLDLNTGQPAVDPRVSAMIYCKNKKGDILLREYNYQPYLGHVGLPFKRIYYGQSMSETANKILGFKANPSGKLSYLGTINIIVKYSKKVTTHYIAHIFKPKTNQDKSLTDNHMSQIKWDNINNYQNSDLINGTKEIIKILETKRSPFFEEIFVKK